MLTRWGNGSHSIERLRGEMDRLFQGLSEGLAPWTGLIGGGVLPALNVWEDERSLYVEAELPGLKMEDLELLVSGGELTIKGQRPEAGGEGVTYHRRERERGDFTRVIRLPVAVEADKVEASLKAGILTIRLPKSDSARMRRIEVKGG